MSGEASKNCPIVDRLDDFIEAVAVAGKAYPILLAAAREMRRDIRILDFVLRAGNDADPGLAVVTGIVLDGREQDDIVDAHDIRLDRIEYARQIILRPFGRLDDHFPAALHVIVDLVIGGFAEIRDMAIDEVDPEFRHFLRRQGFGQVHWMGFETIAPIDIEEARIGEEHHLVAELLQRLADADRIERWPECGFGKQRDHLFRHPQRLAGRAFLSRLLFHRSLLHCLLCHARDPFRLSPNRLSLARRDETLSQQRQREGSWGGLRQWRAQSSVWLIVSTWPLAGSSLRAATGIVSRSLS
jgi:hypothetical protein